jgi:hypothetical protein
MEPPMGYYDSYLGMGFGAALILINTTLLSIWAIKWNRTWLAKNKEVLWTLALSNALAAAVGYGAMTRLSGILYLIYVLIQIQILRKGFKLTLGGAVSFLLIFITLGFMAWFAIGLWSVFSLPGQFRAS